MDQRTIKVSRNFLALGMVLGWTTSVTGAIAATMLVPLSLIAQGGTSETPNLRSIEILVWSSPAEQLFVQERELVRYLQMHPDSSYAHAIFSHLLLRQFSQTPDDLMLIKRASEMAQQSVELEPIQEFGFVAMADVLDVMSQSDKALELLQKASAHGMKAGWRTHFTIARLSANQQPMEQILLHLERALTSDNALPEVVAPYIIAVLQSVQSEDNYESELIRWNNRTPTEAFQQAIAIAMSDRGQYAGASKLYDAILQQRPSAVEAAINNAILLYTHLSNPQRARSLLHLALEQESKTETKLHESTIHLHLAKIEYRLGDHKIAEDLFVQSVQNAGDPVAASALVSRSLRDLNDTKQLARVFDRLTKSVPGVGIMHALLGEVLSEELQEHKQAIEAFRNAVLLEPNRSDFYNGMGLTYYRMRDLEAALQHFNTAVNVNPSDAIARYNEACVLARLGKTPEAMTSLREALSLDPKLVETAKVDGDFAAVRSLADFQRLLVPSADKPWNDDPSESLIGH